MTATTIYRRGHVVVVEVPFSDQSGSRRRPALVVSSDAFHRKLPDLIICPISSQPRYYRQPGPGDHPLRHWTAVGLRHPSTVRISNVVAIDKTIVKRTLGMLDPDDLDRVTDGLRHAFGL